MTKLKEISYTQNQKVADGKSRKMLTFDFVLSHKDEKSIKSEQNISINTCTELSRSNISKEKGQSCTNRIDPNKQTVHQLKKGGLLMI